MTEAKKVGRPKSSLDASSIVTIINACKDAGLSSFKGAGLEIEFNQKEEETNLTITDAAPVLEALEQQRDMTELMISDPEKFEELEQRFEEDKMGGVTSGGSTRRA